MRHRILTLALTLTFLTVPLCVQVQTIGDVSFAVPDGWKYQQGSDYRGMVLIQGKNLRVMAVYTPMPSSGDATTDLKTAWKRIEQNQRRDEAESEPPRSTPD